jgi:hypothetical protein
LSTLGPGLPAAKWASAARIASDLHWLSPTASALQLIDVVSRFGHIGPLLDLLLTRHLDNV